MSEVTSYRVTGDWRHIVDDGMVDLDGLPDEALPTGHVIFTPLSPKVAVAGTPAVAHTLAQVKALIAGGVLTDLQGRPGVSLAGEIGGHTVRWKAHTNLEYQKRKIDYPEVTFDLTADSHLTGLIYMDVPGQPAVVLDPRIEALAASLEEVDQAVATAEGHASDAAAQVALAGQEADRAVGLANAQDEHIAGTLEDPQSATHAAFKAVGNATYETHESAGIKYTPQALGPRDRPRVRSELRPVLDIVDQFPSPEVPYRLLAVEGDTWWGWGADHTLRVSTHEGAAWKKKWAGWLGGNPATAGMWVRTTAGSILTTWHPEDGSAPSIIRSTNDGAAWAEVVPAAAGVDYLGPTNICQNPATGTLWLGEYVPTTNYATNPTYQIKKSTDDGATWTVFKTIQRDPVAHPETAMFHCHGIQVDPFTGDVYVANGDAPANAGIYRILADETDWEPIATNRQLGATQENGIWGGAVGLMFFPDYIAWGVDQSFTSGIVRIARTEIGKTSVAAELTVRLNSTGFYAASMNPDHTEWMVSASQEGVGGRIDNSVHLYRVADQGATVDEVASIPVRTGGASFFWAFPLGNPVQSNNRDISWWGTNIWDGLAQADQHLSGHQFGCRLSWGTQSIVRPSSRQLAMSTPVTQSAGILTPLGPTDVTSFGFAAVPEGMTTLYVVDMGVYGTVFGTASVEIWVSGQSAPSTFYDAGVPAVTYSISEAQSRRMVAGPYMDLIHGLTPGDLVMFRLRNAHSDQVSATGHVTYAWGL